MKIKTRPSSTRYYNPETGRFTSVDIEEGEISNPLDMNRYVCCRNNPIKYVDPSGENWIYNAWNWGEDTIWKGIALGMSAVGWQLTADLLWLAASGSGNTYSATAGSYASNLAKNDAGTVVNTYEYTPWGEIRSETEAVDNPIKYAGEYYDNGVRTIYVQDLS